MAFNFSVSLNYLEEIPNLADIAIGRLGRKEDILSFNKSIPMAVYSGGGGGV